ncbi:hypothetical protein CVT26_010395 [Gymnopilus dilepis]|uniref:Uncharacterized protein n=1 Tax=Gymnopilus dilepis TaxID=231916 RepID=A0A409VZ60_9AGAR|nr:hypothetical protein CVT26_010395 [Gymnopilus dilepis]
MVNSIPLDPRPGPQQFVLDPITREYVSCTTCHSLYPGGDVTTILICNHRKTPDSPICNTPLYKARQLHADRAFRVPIRKYLHQDLKSWVGRLLCRPGVETLLDNPSPDLPHSAHPVVDDIWLTRLFRELKDSTGGHFFPPPSTEGRLIFGLSVDSFNPFYNKTAKQSSSSTGMWLVLLNLPPHLRYLEENLFLAGVIPGHEKPSKEDLYPYLNLLIKDLLEFWHKGVRFSRTYREQRGRLFKAMLIPLICDMLAARQVAGLGSATSHSFCTFCDLDLDDIDVLDRSEWPPKNEVHVRRIAQLWRDATSEVQRSAIFDAYGIRWSPLHDLPYWDAVKYIIIDSMHALDLNLLQNHCRSLFQIDTEAAGGDGYSTQSPDPRQRQLSREAARAYEKCVEQIKRNDANLVDELLLHPRSALYQVSVDNNILGQNHRIVVGTKWVLASNIVAWRQRIVQADVQAMATSYTASHDDAPSHGVSGPSAETANQDASPPEVNMPQVRRVIQNLLDITNQEESRRRAYTQGTVDTLIFISDLLEIDHTDIDRSRRGSKRALFDKLTAKIDGEASALEALEAFLPRSDMVEGRAVLGKEVMNAIWSDMRQTRLPTWLTSPPADWGTTRRGKLSADHWRVICTVHLPITLIRLWHDASPRKQQILQHFMQLVNAVHIGNMRVVSAEHIAAYDFYMTKYIKDIKTLYPDQHLKPTHHAALHIGDMLGLFGPSHSHSSPYYERHINLLHHINTNSKIGELETTYLRTSARRANLRARLLDDNALCQSLSELVEVMKRIDSEDARGFRLASILDPSLPTVPPGARFDGTRQLPTPYAALLRECLNNLSVDPGTRLRQAAFLKEVGLRGVCYGISSPSTWRDSRVLFKGLSSDSNQALRAGVIESIFMYSYTLGGTEVEGVFMAVMEISAIDSSQDPYRSFGPFAGFLCKEHPSQLRILTSSQIISHFVWTKLTEPPFTDLIHIMPVDRLMVRNFIDGHETD